MYIDPEGSQVGIARTAVTAGAWFRSWLVVNFKVVDETPPYEETVDQVGQAKTRSASAGARIWFDPGGEEGVSSTRPWRRRRCRKGRSGWR